MSRTAARLAYTYNGTALKYRPMVYNTQRHAEASAARCLKPHRVMRDEAGLFLVVCPADARRLQRAGLDYA